MLYARNFTLQNVGENIFDFVGQTFLQAYIVFK